MATAAGNLRSRLSAEGWRARWEDPAERRLWHLRFWFYVGVPLLLGFLLGWLRVGRIAAWPLELAVPYWLVLSLATTWLTDLGCRPIAMLLRPLRCPLWLMLLVGQVIAGILLVRPFAQVFVLWANGFVSPELAVAPIGGSLQEFKRHFPSNAVMWTGLNLLFFHAFRMPRFGYVPGAGSGSGVAGPASTRGEGGSGPTIASLAPHASEGARDADVRPAPLAAGEAGTALRTTFLERVRPERRGALLALRAEGHYLRVYTDAGSDMILYRLSDALDEVGGDEGARVHRSWWVAARALADERHAEHLRLTNGLSVPVSRSYRLAARERGWLK
jgi:DNA-binding LytR/AlgR family response regulator